ncbi:hypothetical protein FOI68_02390 [Brevibacillus sp. LEMMJ03]|uniref:hypothetical protein n=1 Tax=Brevibacillus sp. LEMMJ03 TaxID=2595056 RepID=UPI00117D8A6B|nr:hypothetical protein [Brevibacillus sp. LEMMJ03]TRY28226.1 hypothetical protein FOI68_02390 [Brevibacillus sp. LEMMJ03]
MAGSVVGFHRHEGGRLMAGGVVVFRRHGRRTPADGGASLSPLIEECRRGHTTDAAHANRGKGWKHMSKHNGVKNERGGKENPPQTRSSNTISKEDTRAKQRGE